MSIMLAMALQAVAAPSARMDFRNWHATEAVVDGERSCSFALSPNFHGIRLVYRPVEPDIEVMIEPLGVQLLPTHIPLKITANDQVQLVTGVRVDGGILFRMTRSMAERGMGKKGLLSVLISAPGIKDTLLARYHMRGQSYGAARAALGACQTKLRLALLEKNGTSASNFGKETAMLAVAR
ncbi:MAG TPA: hypothetical protein VF463_09140 [Sphingobium sp.]